MTRTVFAVLFCAFAASAVAKDIRVAPDGSGDYRTLVKALEKAEAGDVIVMKKPTGMVGAVLKEEKGEILLDGTVPGSPIEAAGLKKGDRITAVDGVSVSSKALVDVIGMVRGPFGSAVKLTVAGEGGEREVSIVRGETRMPVKDDMSKAHIASGEKDFETALLYAKKAAEAGVTAAQVFLAYAYTRGEGARKDGYAAFAWAAKASTGGDKSAQHLLSLMYRQGAGIHRDEHLADYWLEKSGMKPAGEAK